MYAQVVTMAIRSCYIIPRDTWERWMKAPRIIYVLKTKVEKTFIYFIVQLFFSHLFIYFIFFIENSRSQAF